MMYAQIYAQERLNKMEAEQRTHAERIAQHWYEDARTVPANPRAIVRFMSRVFGRRNRTRAVVAPLERVGRLSASTVESTAERSVESTVEPPESPTSHGNSTANLAPEAAEREGSELVRAR